MRAERAEVLGCPVDRLTMKQTLLRIEELIGQRRFSQHVAINAAKLVAMQDDPELRRIVERCEVVSADGQSIVWASRILGDPVPERVAGIDLMQQLLGLAEQRGFRVFVLGARADVLERARQEILRRHPRLALVGVHDGYFSDEEAERIAGEIRDLRPDILFVAMPSPRKERWIARHGPHIDVPFVMGVGGSIDVIAGVTRRAPVVLQRLGLEWSYRLLQEPGRLWRRYASTNLRFALLILRARRRGRDGPRRAILRPSAGAVIAMPIVLARDAAATVPEGWLPPRDGIPAGALDEAIAWLCRSHDATGRRGSSKGFSLLHGWLPAYPETTGYVLETLLAYAQRRPDEDQLVARAREMGAWEVSVQDADGGIMEGHVRTRPRRSIVFNTGMVLHGWTTLVEAGFREFEAPAARAARFLVANMRADGTWRPAVEYGGIPHTYNARVAWAMLRWARHADDADVTEAARRQLCWTVSRQTRNGWFADCVFKAASDPSTHGIAYTMRGLLESYAIEQDDGWLAAVERTAEVLARKLELSPRLPANFDASWRPTSRHACLTGTAQLGGVWLRLHTITGDLRWLNAGLKAVEQAVRRQERLGWAPIRGALPGSFPTWGRYAPLQYPNWATRFLADSLMLYESALQT